MQFTDASDLLTSTAGPPTSHLGPGGSFKNLPILAKLLIAFGMVLAVCTVISVFSLLQLHAIKQDLEKITDGAALLQQRSHLIAGVSAAFWILIASLGAGAIGVMLSSLFIKIAVVRPIEAARDEALRIAQRDLTGHIAIDSIDETGALSVALASMQRSLKASLGATASLASAHLAGIRPLSF